MWLLHIAVVLVIAGAPLAPCHGSLEHSSSPTQEQESYIELTTFDEIASLATNPEAVGLMRVVIHASHCQAQEELIGHMHVAIELDAWVLADLGNGAMFFRTNKNYNENGVRVFGKFLTLNNNGTMVTFRYFSGKDLQLVDELVLQCPIGDGARFYAYGYEKPTASLSDYEDLKAAVFAGTPVNVKAFVSDCDGYSLDYASILVSKWIDGWEVTNLGAPEEALSFFWELWNDHHLDEALVGVERITALITPDGTVRYTPAIFDLVTWNEGFNVGPDGFTCALGESFVATIHDEMALPMVEYASFEELERAFEEDHQIQIVVQASECEWDSPPGPYDPAVFSIKPALWTLHRSEDRTFAGFFDHVTNEIGMLQVQYAVESDGKVTLAMQVIDMVNEQLGRRDVAVCDLGTGVVLRGNLGPRVVLEDYASLREVLMDEGKTVGWYADLKQCTGFLGDITVEAGGTFPAGNFFDPRDNNGTFSASVVQLANPDESGEKFAWAALTVYWVVDAEDGANKMVITFSERDVFTWEDSFGEQGVTDPTVCTVGFPDAYLFV